MYYLNRIQDFNIKILNVKKLTMNLYKAFTEEKLLWNSL